MIRTPILAGIVLLSISHPLVADGEIDRSGHLSQSEFHLLSKDLGTALGYESVTPARQLGTAGIKFGVDLLDTRVQTLDLLDRESSDGYSSSTTMPRFRLHKGLPGGVDLGAFYSAHPDSDIELWGAEARYSFLKGRRIAPSISLRGTISQLSGDDQLDLDTTGIELSISKGFTNFRPYAGWGRVWVRSTPTGSVLNEEDFSEEKYFLGATLNFGVFNLDLEGDRTGDTTSYNLKFGWRF